MAFTYRVAKGSELTWPELDANFQTMEDLHDATQLAKNASETAADTATSEADAAMGYRNTAGTYAGTATTQAGIATDKRGEAVTAAATAVQAALDAGADAEAVALALANVADGPVISVNGNTGIVALTTPFIFVTSTAQPAVGGVQYGLSNAAASTLTLPSAPALDTLVFVVVLNSRSDNVLARSGSLIWGLAENLTIDDPKAIFAAKFVGGTLGWITL